MDWLEPGCGAISQESVWQDLGPLWASKEQCSEQFNFLGQSLPILLRPCSLSLMRKPCPPFSRQRTKHGQATGLAEVTEGRDFALLLYYLQAVCDGAEQCQLVAPKQLGHQTRCQEQPQLNIDLEGVSPQPLPLSTLPDNPVCQGDLFSFKVKEHWGLSVTEVTSRFPPGHTSSGHGS